MTIPYFIYLSALDGHLGHFQRGAVLKSAGLNILMWSFGEHRHILLLCIESEWSCWAMRYVDVDRTLLFSGSVLFVASGTKFMGLSLYLGDRPIHWKINSCLWGLRCWWTERFADSETTRWKSGVEIRSASFPLLSALLIDFRDNLVSALPEGQCSPKSDQRTTYRGKCVLQVLQQLYLSQESDSLRMRLWFLTQQHLRTTSPA